MLAVGPKNAKNLCFSIWETILSEIIIGDAFGVDRMDYLLRNSHHSEVVYGRYDNYRLIDTYRILPFKSSHKPELRVEEGGLHSAEALMLESYLMYSQVYCHPVRRIYNIHLTDFFKEWLKGRKFSTSDSEHLRLTDNEVTAALLVAAHHADKPGHLHAQRILDRKNFKLLHECNPSDLENNPEAGSAVFRALSGQFDANNFREDRYSQSCIAPDFPVKLHNSKVESSLDMSDTLNRIPVVSVDRVFAERSTIDQANVWLEQNQAEINRLAKEEKEKENGSR